MAKTCHDYFGIFSYDFLEDPKRGLIGTRDYNPSAPTINTHRNSLHASDRVYNREHSHRNRLRGNIVPETTQLKMRLKTIPKLTKVVQPPSRNSWSVCFMVNR